MEKTINVKWDFGEIVELVTDMGTKRVVTGYVLRQSGKLYELSTGTENSWHQEVEIGKFSDNSKIKGFKK